MFRLYFPLFLIAVLTLTIRLGSSFAVSGMIPMFQWFVMPPQQKAQILGRT